MSEKEPLLHYLYFQFNRATLKLHSAAQNARLLWTDSESVRPQTFFFCRFCVMLESDFYGLRDFTRAKLKRRNKTQNNYVVRPINVYKYGMNHTLGSLSSRFKRIIFKNSIKIESLKSRLVSPQCWVYGLQQSTKREITQIKNAFWRTWWANIATCILENNHNFSCVMSKRVHSIYLVFKWGLVRAHSLRPIRWCKFGHRKEKKV